MILNQFNMNHSHMITAINSLMKLVRRNLLGNGMFVCSRLVLGVSLVLLSSAGTLFAQNGNLEVTSVVSEPVTGVTVITYDFSGTDFAYSISVEVSFDTGQTYHPISPDHLSGDVECVNPGTGKQITWDGAAGFPNIFSKQSKLRLTASPLSAGTFVDDRDLQHYKWVKIGNQLWMAENLKYLPAVAHPTSGSLTEPYYYVGGYYDGTDVDAAKAKPRYQEYGVLYNWPAAMSACPTGWHLPDFDEWEELVNYVISEGYSNEWNNPNAPGNALKSCRQIDSTLGVDCNTSVHPRWSANDTHHGFDAFGFAALPGGSRGKEGSVYAAGNYGHWWTATEYFPETEATLRNMVDWHGHVSQIADEKSAGTSVRCVKTMN
jgi:uncharacterized protein (TIGR02145 family)